MNENTKITLTIGQLRRLVKEGYSYWSHGDNFTGWDDMICAIEDKWGKEINDMTEDEKHKAYVDFALRDYGCNPIHIQSSMIDCTKGAASRWASDLVWGKTSDWPTQLPAADELVTRFEAYSRDKALREFVDEVKEELEEHDLKAVNMKGWLEDEVKKNPRVAKYLKAPDIGSIKDYEKESLEWSFKDKFVDSIGAKMWKVYGGKQGIRKAFYSMGCYDELGDLTFTDRENYYTHEPIPAETSPEQLCADWDNFVSQMGFDGAPEWAMELLYQRGYYKYYAAGNTSWSNPGGRNPKRTYADLKAAMSKVSAVAENSKITLTLGQLKKLVKEGNRYLDDFVPLDSVRDWIENGDEETFDLDDDDGDYEYIDSVMAIRRKHHDQVQVKGNVPKGFNAKRCPKCGGMGIYYIDSDAMGHEVWGHIECAKCGAHASEELEGPDEDRPKDEVIGILVDRWNSGKLDDTGM